ncbi:hypothetical protein [Sagittula salina]|uniref:Lipoprotein n=1 Tax=Sagittula salina TaxID=2820268 RepID=A0A940MV23_9RHOB|nr:hypothetical protein [Sagittula salina]MBP0483449.1 hypothetical protein [Sagittula salina]
MFRVLAILTLMLGLSACTDATQDLARPVEPLGNFTLGHAIVVAPNVQKLLVSREASSEEWIEAVDAAIEKRFRRYSGGRFYHFGLSVEAYSLPPPVVPGKSALALRLTVWDDAAKRKLNEETEVIQVIQVFETRLGLTREEQIQRLADQAALQIEDWLRERMTEDDWFRAPGGDIPADAIVLPADAPVPATAGAAPPQG